MNDDRNYDVLAAKLTEAEARIAHLESHIEGVAKDTHKIMVAYEAALPAVYRLALEDAYWSREVTPTPTAAELMARIQTGEKE
jgi:hypothetical protein